MLQTQFSVQASDLADTFRSTVGRTRVGPYGYAPDMTAPEGPSTGGGVQAMQHLRLLPPQPNMPTLVVGHLNQRLGTAELRSLEYVDAICRERFQQAAPLDPAQYATFVAHAQTFLGTCGLRVTIAGPPPDLLASLSRPKASLAPPPPGNRTFVVVVTLALVAALASAIGWFLFKK